MELTAAIVPIRQLTLALVLVPDEQTYPEPGARLLATAQQLFPTLPIMLVTPRVRGFSRSFAHFDVSSLMAHINTEEIAWRSYRLGTTATAPAPF